MKKEDCPDRTVDVELDTLRSTSVLIKHSVVGLLNSECSVTSSLRSPRAECGYSDVGFENWQRDRLSKLVEGDIHTGLPVLLSTGQVRGVGAAAPPPSGASHLSAPTPDERARGISPRPMQGDMGRSANQQKTDPSSISSVTDRWGTRQVSRDLQKSSFSVFNTENLKPDMGSDSDKNSHAKNYTDSSSINGYARNTHDFHGIQNIKGESGKIERSGNFECISEHESIGNCEYGFNAVPEGLDTSKGRNAPVSSDRISEKVRSFSIPGSGEITDPEQCGNWFKVAACSVDPKHYKKNITHSCGHIVCPTCWRDPVYKAAKTASGRIRGFIADAIDKKLHCGSYSELVLNHYVLSAPAGLIMPDMPYNQIKQKGRDMATKAGIWGGFMAFHPWRLKKRIIQQLSALCIEHANMGEEEREKRFWEMVRDDVLQLGSWRAYVRWSPHFHAIGFGRLPDQNTEEEKESVKKLYKGWVVVWIRHVETYHQFTGQRIADPIADLAAYILSHAGYQENKKMPVWLGELSQNKMYVKVIIKQEYGVICPKCQADVIMGADQMGVFVPDINSATGKPIPRILKNREYIYVIGKNPNCKRKRSRREKIWHDVVPAGVAFQQQREAARLDRLKMGIT